MFSRYVEAERGKKPEQRVPAEPDVAEAGPNVSLRARESYNEFSRQGLQNHESALDTCWTGEEREELSASS